ncbi:hypothetical protein PNH38_05525 [Anoxybacillus rupiensis]|uniref:Uncharacterized protein n=1 Tax=Anoxybacteroides rupiense TaxID=311460 RepID=A0ABT5W1Z7_9BACL|nr:hypothetical protein [Anoxybacillus rupiensis]MBB3907878.1 hypothetical protein [Anoxybacillus rupiensis]MDE8563347.1 hypothetical protein [Anoxybacillus rupiensis]
MEDILKQIFVELQKISGRLERMEQGQEEIRFELAELKQGQEQLQKNIINNLGLYNEKNSRICR